MNDEVKSQEQEPIQAAQEELKEKVTELTEEQIKQLNSLVIRSNWKERLTGTRNLLSGPKKKTSKSWYNGSLLSAEEMSKLSWEEIHKSNNVIGKTNRG